VTFARNGDASVFAGVSGSKASPYVLLLLRTTRREMTLSEHKTSAPAEVSIFFTPDSQRVFYHSDRQGKPAIYAVPAERLVERIEDKQT
jgi:oligogalacturonide lyase